MDSYYVNWRDEASEKGGAKKGFTTTASKRKGDFEKYVGIVAESRETSNAELWSEWLMEVANTKLMKSNNEQEGCEELGGIKDKEDTVPMDDKARKYLNYASRGLGDDSSSDSSSDEDGDEHGIVGV